MKSTHPTFILGLSFLVYTVNALPATQKRQITTCEDASKAIDTFEGSCPAFKLINDSPFDLIGGIFPTNLDYLNIASFCADSNKCFEAWRSSFADVPTEINPYLWAIDICKKDVDAKIWTQSGIIGLFRGRDMFTNLACETDEAGPCYLSIQKLLRNIPSLVDPNYKITVPESRDMCRPCVMDALSTITENFYDLILLRTPDQGRENFLQAVRRIQTMCDIPKLLILSKRQADGPPPNSSGFGDLPSDLGEEETDFPSDEAEDATATIEYAETISATPLPESNTSNSESTTSDFETSETSLSAKETSSIEEISGSAVESTESTSNSETSSASSGSASATIEGSVTAETIPTETILPETAINAGESSTEAASSTSITLSSESTSTETPTESGESLPETTEASTSASVSEEGSSASETISASTTESAADIRSAPATTEPTETVSEFSGSSESANSGVSVAAEVTNESATLTSEISATNTPIESISETVTAEESSSVKTPSESESSTEASTESVTTSPQKGDWEYCTTSQECDNGCCSKEFSDDGKLKCTPGGMKCVESTAASTLTDLGTEIATSTVLENPASESTESAGVETIVSGGSDEIASPTGSTRILQSASIEESAETSSTEPDTETTDLGAAIATSNASGTPTSESAESAGVETTVSGGSDEISSPTGSTPVVQSTSIEESGQKSYTEPESETETSSSTDAPVQSPPGGDSSPIYDNSGAIITQVETTSISTDVATESPTQTESSILVESPESTSSSEATSAITDEATSESVSGSEASTTTENEVVSPAVEWSSSSEAAMPSDASDESSNTQEIITITLTITELNTSVESTLEPSAQDNTTAETVSASPTLAAKLGDWEFCTSNDQCDNGCCSKQYSGDGMLKCTPGGSECSSAEATTATQGDSLVETTTLAASQDTSPVEQTSTETMSPSISEAGTQSDVATITVNIPEVTTTFTDELNPSQEPAKITTEATAISPEEASPSGTIVTSEISYIETTTTTIDLVSTDSTPSSQESTTSTEIVTAEQSSSQFEQTTTTTESALRTEASQGTTDVASPTLESNSPATSQESVVSSTPAETTSSTTDFSSETTTSTTSAESSPSSISGAEATSSAPELLSPTSETAIVITLTTEAYTSSAEQTTTSDSTTTTGKPPTTLETSDSSAATSTTTVFLTTTVSSPSTSAQVSPSPLKRKLKTWAPCTSSDQCRNRCCSKEYSGGVYKCTPKGSQCLTSPLGSKLNRRATNSTTTQAETTVTATASMNMDNTYCDIATLSLKSFEDNCPAIDQLKKTYLFEGFPVNMTQKQIQDTCDATKLCMADLRFDPYAQVAASCNNELARVRGAVIEFLCIEDSVGSAYYVVEKVIENLLPNAGYNVTIPSSDLLCRDTVLSVFKKLTTDFTTILSSSGGIRPVIIFSKLLSAISDCYTPSNATASPSATVTEAPISQSMPTNVDVYDNSGVNATESTNGTKKYIRRDDPMTSSPSPSFVNIIIDIWNSLKNGTDLPSITLVSPDIIPTNGTKKYIRRQDSNGTSTSSGPSPSPSSFLDIIVDIWNSLTNGTSDLPTIPLISPDIIPTPLSMSYPPTFESPLSVFLPSTFFNPPTVTEVVVTETPIA
ncbi:hypothetical protein HK098_006860 [Nowakowskiella sp. JEL0407]|nr:hypothetical protein HK098_006860 [Nowakowskiella sp. JEL0407]